MEQLRKFLRGKGFALALAACLLAAAAAGVWTVRLIRSELQKNLDGLSPSSTVQPAVPDADIGTKQEADPWKQDTAPAANSASGVPEPASRQPAASSSPSASSAPGSGSVSEPAALQSDSAPVSRPSAPVSTQPVSGRVLAVFSGDELVYNKTLGDWRTHNGVDYACKPGETVSSPVEGKVTGLETDGSWGPTVSLTDAQGRVWRLCGVSAAVRQGQTVSAGQKLGKAATVSCECEEEPHIHMEVQQGDRYLDPQKLMH